MCGCVRRAAISISIRNRSAPIDAAVIGHVAAMARQKTTQLQAGTPAASSASNAQYREALSDIERGDLPVAATELTAALARAQQNPMFRGDLAYVYARMGRSD